MGDRDRDETKQRGDDASLGCCAPSRILLYGCGSTGATLEGICGILPILATVTDSGTNQQQQHHQHNGAAATAVHELGMVSGSLRGP
jgi:hypothetical protein